MHEADSWTSPSEADMAEKQKNKNRKIGRSQRNGARYRVLLQRERNKLKRIKRPRAAM